MRRRTDYTSAPRSSGGASYNSSEYDGDSCADVDNDDAANKRRSKDYDYSTLAAAGSSSIAITPARVVGGIVVIFCTILIVSGNREWPPKNRRLIRKPPFIRGRIFPNNQWQEDEIARQRRKDNMNLVKWHQQEKEEQRKEHDQAVKHPATILSRDPKGVRVMTDVEGNLGPSSVLNQVDPGDDWLKDRWQAASDMHGTEIKGEHWVEVDFFHLRDQDMAFWPAYAVLDWETALSTDYVIYGRRKLEDESDSWTVFFDSKKHDYDTATSGKSPGVKKDMPLHYVHNVTLKERLSPEAIKFGIREEPKLIDAVRIVIRSSDHGWGVSLWQVDIYGWQGDVLV